VQWFHAAAIIIIITAFGLHAQTTPVVAPDAGELTSLLKEFLTSASRNDPAVHDRFWADDVIYTGPRAPSPAMVGMHELFS
jgi:hypothetical protein